MTICAGFNSTYGVVMSSDSQETRGTMKLDAPKLIIKPDLGDPGDKVRMMFAGAGDGPFIDKLIDEMWKAAKSGPDFKMQDVFGRVEDAVIEWHRRIWQAYGDASRPFAELLFAIYVPHEIRLYKSIGPIVTIVDTHDFAGIGTDLAAFLTDHVRGECEGIEEEVSTSLYIIGNAAKYVDGCGGDTQIAAMMLDGSIHTMSVGDTRAFADGILRISREVFYLFSLASNLDSKREEIDRSARMTARGVHSIRAELRKGIRERIRVGPKLRKSVKRLFYRQEWPPTR